MITEFMTVSGWFFWALITVFVLIESAALRVYEGDGLHHPGPFIAGVLALAVIALFTDAFVGVTWATLAIVAALYFAAGAVYSLVRWLQFVRSELERARVDFRSRDRGAVEFTQWSKDNHRRPDATDQKVRITNWIALWPVCMALRVLEWPLKLTRWIWRKLSGAYAAITDRVWASN